MPRLTRVSGKSRQTLKQTTLLDHLGRSSSPPTSSPERPLLIPTASPPTSSPVAPKRKSQSTSSRGLAQINSGQVRSDSESDVEAIQFEPRAPIPDEDAPDESPRRPRKKQRRTALGDAENDSEEEISSLPRRRSKSRINRTRRAVPSSGDDGQESEAESQKKPRRGKLVKGIRPPTPEEPDDLMAGLDEDKIIEPRLRTRNKRSAYLENLEKLKRRKRGELHHSSESEHDEHESNVVDVDVWTPIKGAKPPGAGGDSVSEEEDDEDSAFVVDDDETAMPMELPAAYSMNTHQDLSHQFKIICQLFVHLAVKHVEERGEFMEHAMRNLEYFSVPLQVVRRKLEGLRDSAVASSVWRTDFKRPLETRPDLELVQLDFAIPTCDACHLGGRLSTRCARVSGAPYDRSTFEPLQTEDSDDELDDELETRPNISFNLGRFCARRTQVFHEFNHWEYHLYRSLCREIDMLRPRDKRAKDFVRVAFAGGKKPPEDLTDADGICDWLDQRGIISEEWRRVKDMMESARNLEMRAKNDEDD